MRGRGAADIMEWPFDFDGIEVVCNLYITYSYTPGVYDRRPEDCYPDEYDCDIDFQGIKEVNSAYGEVLLPDATRASIEKAIDGFITKEYDSIMEQFTKEHDLY